MVDRSDRPYVSNSDGAPPLPPPGGYRGARRGRQVAPATLAAGKLPSDSGDAAAQATTEATGARRRPNALGWSVLGGAVLFALVLLVMLAAGAVDGVYGTTMLVLQLIVLVGIIAALATRRGRLLGCAALTVTLLLNVATVGGLGALSAEAGGGYDGRKTEEQKHWEAYPGVKDRSASEILAQASLEETRAVADDLLADVRERLTDDFGFTWVQVADEVTRPERNGYGGESMLVRYTSTGWATTEPLTSYSQKLAVMYTIEDVVLQNGFSSMFAFNDPDTGVDPTVIQKLYGGSEPENQVMWEWYADVYPDPARFYATMIDLSNDSTGEYRASREATSARTGEPLEGLQIAVLADELLSEADAAEFQERMADYE